MIITALLAIGGAAAAVYCGFDGERNQAAFFAASSVAMLLIYIDEAIKRHRR